MGSDLPRRGPDRGGVGFGGIAAGARVSPSSCSCSSSWSRDLADHGLRTASLTGDLAAEEDVESSAPASARFGTTPKNRFLAQRMYDAGIASPVASEEDRPRPNIRISAISCGAVRVKSGVRSAASSFGRLLHPLLRPRFLSSPRSRLCSASPQPLVRGLKKLHIPEALGGGGRRAEPAGPAGSRSLRACGRPTPGSSRRPSTCARSSAGCGT